jgi:hypothetical protein
VPDGTQWGDVHASRKPILAPHVLTHLHGHAQRAAETAAQRKGVFVMEPDDG